MLAGPAIAVRMWGMEGVGGQCVLLDLCLTWRMMAKEASTASDTREQGAEIRVQSSGGPGDFVTVP